MTTDSRDVEVALDSLQQAQVDGFASTLSKMDGESDSQLVGRRDASRGSTQKLIFVALLAASLGLLVGFGLGPHVLGGFAMRGVALQSNGSHQEGISNADTGTHSTATALRADSTYAIDNQDKDTTEMDEVTVEEKASPETKLSYPSVGKTQRKMSSTRLTVREPPRQTRSFSMSVRDAPLQSRSYSMSVRDAPQATRSFSMSVREPQGTTPPVSLAAVGDQGQPQLNVPDQAFQPPPSFSIGTGQSDVSWPELVGLPGEEAKKIIEDRDEGYSVVIVPLYGATPRDLRMDRVFLYVNEAGHVANVPRPGR